MTTRAEYEARRDRWADALESGEYEQGTEYLCRDGRYCCLGVACEVFEEEAGLSRTVGAAKIVAWNGSQKAVPKDLGSLLGLSGLLGERLIFDPSCRSLAGLNDEGTPFKVIARLLREEPENWFTWAQEDEG